MSIQLPSLPGLGDAPSPTIATNAPLSPAALQAQRDYAKALMLGTTTKGTGPQFPVVQSWTQGVSNMVNALMGGGEEYNARQREAQARNTDAANTNVTADATPQAKTSFEEGHSSEGHEKTAGGDDSASKAISGIESGGDYNSVGRKTHTGDQAYGKYQVMGANIPQWTQEALGTPMTPAEFLSNPQAQEAVFKQKFGEYTQKYGPEGAAKAWFAGEHGMNNPSARDINGMTVARYAQKFDNLGGGGGGSAMAFDGNPDRTATPAVSAITSALRGGAAAAPVAGQPHQAMPNGSGIYVDPSLVPRRPQLSQQQMQGILQSPTLDQATKERYQAIFLQQHQPLELPYPGGKVLVDPTNPTRQQFIPDLQKNDVTIDGMKTTKPYTIGPGGAPAPDLRQKAIPPSPMDTIVGGPHSEATPVAPPVAAPAGAPAAAGPMPPNVAQNAPPAAAAPLQAPVQVASADPQAAFAAAAGKPAIPGVATVGQPAVPPVSATPIHPLAQLAANDDKLRQMFGSDEIDAMKQKKQYDQEQAIQLEQQKADIATGAAAKQEANKLNSKRYEDMMATTSAAFDQGNNLRTARALTNDQNFYSGLANGVVENWKRLKSALGIDPDAAAPMEVFKKTTATSIMTGLKTAFQGLGQIRVAEIKLQELANANTSNTPTAIKALLEINTRNAEKVQQIGQMATAYKNGDAIVDPNDPSKVYLPANKIDPETGEPEERLGLDAHWDRVLQKFQKEHPTFSEAEYNDFANVLKGDHKGEPEMPGKAEAPKAAGSLEETQPGMTYKGYLFNGGDKHDQKNWEKAKAP